MRFWKFTKDELENLFGDQNPESQNHFESSEMNNNSEQGSQEQSQVHSSKQQIEETQNEDNLEQESEEHSQGHDSSQTNKEQKQEQSSKQQTEEAQNSQQQDDNLQENDVGSENDSRQESEEQSQWQSSNQGNDENSQVESSEEHDEKQSQDAQKQDDELQDNDGKKCDESSEEQTEEFQNEDSLGQDSQEQSQGQSSNQGNDENSQVESSEEQDEKQSQDAQKQDDELQDNDGKKYDESSEEQTEEFQNEDSLGQDSQEQSQGQSSNQGNDENSQVESSEEHDEKQSQDAQKQDDELQDNDGKKYDESSEEQTEEFPNNLENEKKEKLQQLRDKLLDYANKKAKELEKNNLQNDDVEPEDSEDLEYNNQFIEQLKDLPSFKDRQHSKGYSIDANSNTELPESLVRTLINKFLNQRFCKRNTDLNVRSNSLEKTNGYYKWEVKDIIVHFKTNQLNKVLEDKYGYDYSSGKSENIPLSFYFDLSSSMSKYSNMLAVLAIELLKNDVKVLIGFNQYVNVQINRINRNMTLEELVAILTQAGRYYKEEYESVRNDSRISCKIINKEIDEFLNQSHAEKCVVFSDFDPLKQIVKLSNSTEVYWFCFEKEFTRSDLKNYSGFLYPVSNAQSILEGLIKVNEKRFESLVFLDNPKDLQRRIK